MVVGPIEMTGMVTRTADFAQMKAAEDGKVISEHALAQARVDKKTEDKNKQVLTKDNVDHHEYKYDAKEGGGNAYSGSGNGNKKKKEEEDGRVIVKSQSKGFDFRV